MMESSERIAVEGKEHPSITEAMLDVLEAGQQVILDRIELVRLETLRGFSHVQHQLLLFAAAGLLFFTAWVAFNCTATLFLAERLSWVVAGSITAGVNAAASFALVAWASKRTGTGPHGTAGEAQ